MFTTNSSTEFDFVLRADGNQQIGLGHLMRLKTLFIALQNVGSRVVFVTVGNKFTKNFFKTTDNVFFIRQVDRRNTKKWPVAKIYIVDLYEFNDQFYSNLKKNKCNKVIIFDDVNTEKIPLHVDGVINHNIYAKDDQYPKRLYRFCGAKYFLLRNEIINSEKNDSPENVLVCMGGSDPEEQTFRIVETLQEITSRTIDVILGGLEPKIKENGKFTNKNVNIHHNPSNFLQIINRAKYAVTGAGTLAYELAYLGIPMLTIVLSENQYMIAESIEKNKAGINLGVFTELNRERLTKHIRMMETFESKLDTFSKNGKELIDGKGGNRLAIELTDLIKKV